MTPRRCTYRLQLRPDFGFDAAADLCGYLASLGVSDLYCSPILQATQGSTHGYDVVDHSRVSDQLGGEAAFARLVDRARSLSMGVTVDVVPNHMAIDGRDNRWWWDVLENGPSSLYASYFDIDWPGDNTRPEQTVLVPILGDRYGRVLDRGEVRLRREGGSFFLTYFDHELPVSPRTLDHLLDRAGSENLAELGRRFGGLPHASRTDPAAVRFRHEEKERLREQLAVLLASDPTAAEAVDRAVEAVNSDPDLLDGLLCRQNYRLAYWKAAREELDYRRFFNIETLVGLRMEDDRVFAETHETLGRLVRDGSVSGVRVDHVDGLLDPEGYLQRLRRLAPATYVAVEKILESDERLPAEWPVEGTTGYDFIARVTNAFVDPAAEEHLTKCYASLTSESVSWTEVVRAAKRQVMIEDLAPEFDRLARLLHTVCEAHRAQRDRTAGEVRGALEAVLAAFPVYRTYVQPDRRRRPEDAARVAEAVRGAAEVAPEADPDLLGFIGELLLLEWPGGAETDFALRFPQVSAPVMAKGVEDTAFYRYNRLVSLNEVGGDPGVFGRPLADFHAGCGAAAEHQPRGMLTLATHDTKRSPDVRARISLLSEEPEHWEEAVTRWMGSTDRHAGTAGPDYNTRYLFFQTLVGAWPIETDRVAGYMAKAAKEAKVFTSWTDPNADYDYCLRRFVEATLSDEGFVADLERYLMERRTVELGKAASLAQAALLLTCPGVPDVYQGTETWDNSLVDPDNRRPVDFDALARRLGAGEEHPATSKLALTALLLGHRARRPELYDGAPYEPLPADGDHSDDLIAFSRGRLVVVATRRATRLSAWGATTVELPPGRWRFVSGAAREEVAGGRQRVGDLLGPAPVAVLEG